MSFHLNNCTHVIIAYDYYVFGLVCVQQFVNNFVGLSMCAKYHAIRLHVKWIVASHFLFHLSTAMS